MKETIETRPTPVAPAAKTPEIIELVERPAAVIPFEVAMADFPQTIGEAFRLTAEAITKGGAVIAGMPFIRYMSFGELIAAEAGFPYAGKLVPIGKVIQTMLPGGRAVTTTHVGPYDEIGAAWDRAQAWMKEHELEMAGPPWEAYLTGPDDPGPAVTEIYWPIR